MMRPSIIKIIILIVMVHFITLSSAVEPIKFPQNPIEGTWEWVNIKNGCVETYIFAADGSSHITSGTEISEASYQIAKKPSEKGFYKVTLKIIKDKGGKDCSDEEQDNTGEEYTKYLMFHPAGGQYVSCDKEDIHECVGPLRRVD